MGGGGSGNSDKRQSGGKKARRRVRRRAGEELREKPSEDLWDSGRRVETKVGKEEKVNNWGRGEGRVRSGK